MRWCFVYHDPEPASAAWTLPRGFAAALQAEGVELWSVPFIDPSQVVLPSCVELDRRQIDVILVFYAGRSEALERELLRIRQGTDLLIVNELGDEPQTRHLNAVRAQLSDLCLSPDASSTIFWQSMGVKCVWFTHWADTKIFRLTNRIHNSTERKNIIVTTIGNRKYSLFLRAVLQSKFINKYCVDEENTKLYNSAAIAFQYARWNEITRRIFEGAACGCCVVTNQLPEGTNFNQLLKAGKEVIVYRNYADLAFKLIYLLLKPRKSAQIGKAGYQKVLKYHTVEARAQELVSMVNKLLKKAEPKSLP